MKRAAFLKEAKRIAAAIEELVDDIELDAADDPATWTAFDVRRTTLDLKVAARLVVDVERKLRQVGTWDKPNETT